MKAVTFSFFITTYNRLDDLRISLNSLEEFLERPDIECLICDDASTDGTSAFIRDNYPKIRLFTNTKKKGLIHNRNALLREVCGQYAISIDDDLNFISSNVLQIIENHFVEYPKCGVLGFRVFWGKNEPSHKQTNETHRRVKDFIGCAHAFKMEAWRDIPEYPEWFIFYGEENYASYQFFKHDWEIHYVPQVLGHHRVDMKARRSNTKDFFWRQRRALRAGWYVYFMCLPLNNALKLWLYSIWYQLKKHLAKGRFYILPIMILAFVDLVKNSLKILREENRLTKEEFKRYQSLPNIPVYWTPKRLNNAK